MRSKSKTAAAAATNPMLGLSPSEAFAKALARLFPGQTASNWKPWKKPSPSLSIDDAISKLVKEKRGARLRDRDELKRAGILCPYYAARQAAAFAAMFATAETETRELLATISKKNKDAGSQARGLSQALAKFIRDHREYDFAGGGYGALKRTDLEEYNAELAASGKDLKTVEAAASALERLATMADEQEKKNKPAKASAMIWHKTFAQSFGYSWTRLIGKPPNSPSGFGDFVAAAYASIGGEGDVSWEWVVRTATDQTNARPRWDQFDKYVKGYDPPGVKRLTAEETQAFFQKRENDWKMKLREVESLAASGLDHPLADDARETLKGPRDAHFAGKVTTILSILEILNEAARERDK